MSTPRSKGWNFAIPLVKEKVAAPRICDMPGCIEHGLYPAPKSRDRLREFHWFCFDHVREYNLSWDYYSNMSEDEIEEHRRADTVGWRPSWPMGKGQMAEKEHFIRSGTSKYRTHAYDHATKDKHGASEPQALKRDALEALAVLDLEPPVEFATIKAKYKQLVKIHHPDANGGAVDSDEKLKTINHAFTVLKAIYKGKQNA